MRRFAFVLVSALLSLAVFAGESRSIEELTVDLKGISRIVSLSKDIEHERGIMLAIVDDDVEALREPRGDGTYRWAALERVEDGRKTEEAGLEKVYTETEIHKVKVSAPNAFRLLVSLPEKRNLFSANNRVYVRKVTLEMTAFDGKKTQSEISVDTWINPKDSHGIPLPEISKNTTAIVELGVESGTKKASANVSLIQAKLVDSPQSPHFSAVSRLLQIRRLVAEKDINRSNLKQVVDEAILNMPGELEKQMAARNAEAEARRQMIAAGATRQTVAAGDATPDVVFELGKILKLTSGTIDDQTAARTALQSLLNALAPGQAKPADPQPAPQQ